MITVAMDATVWASVRSMDFRRQLVRKPLTIDQIYPTVVVTGNFELVVAFCSIRTVFAGYLQASEDGLAAYPDRYSPETQSRSRSPWMQLSLDTNAGSISIVSRL